MQAPADDLYPLAVVESSFWPQLAQTWLEAGHDSPLLREFAGLTAARAAETGELMIADVLRSIGVSINPAVPFSVAEVSGFADRCRSALAVVQRDLNRTGWGWCQLELRDVTQGGECPSMAVVLRDGRGTTSDLITPDVDEAGRLHATVASVKDTMIEFVVVWPRCTAHPGARPLVTAPAPEGFGAGTAQVWWWCREGHPAQPVGELIDALPPRSR